MATTDRRTAMIVCKWCDQPTPAGGRCVACDGDPDGPFPRSSGLAAVRERRLAARQAMLASRRRTPPGPDAAESVPAPLPAGRFVPDESVREMSASASVFGTEPDTTSAEDRLRAALELAPQIVDPTDPGTGPAGPAGPAAAIEAAEAQDPAPLAPAAAGPASWLMPGVDLGDPTTWPPVPTGDDRAAPVAPQPAPSSGAEAPSPASLAALADMLAGQGGSRHAPSIDPPVGAPGTADGAAPADPAGRAAFKAARRQAWAAPERGRPWTLPPDLDPSAAGANAGTVKARHGGSPGHRPRRLRKVAVALLALGAALAAGVTILHKPGKPSPSTTVAVAPAASQAVWVSVHGQNFTASFPGPAARSATSIPHVPGVSGPAQVWQADDGTGAYSVTGVSLASGPGLNRSAVATALINGSAAGAHATVRSVTPSVIGPYAVDDVTLAAPAGTVVSERVMVSTQAAWVLAAVGKAQTPSGWLTFLRSFDPSA